MHASYFLCFFFVINTTNAMIFEGEEEQKKLAAETIKASCLSNNPFFRHLSKENDDFFSDTTTSEKEYQSKSSSTQSHTLKNHLQDLFDPNNKTNVLSENPNNNDKHVKNNKEAKAPRLFISSKNRSFKILKKPNKLQNKKHYFTLIPSNEQFILASQQDPNCGITVVTEEEFFAQTPSGSLNAFSKKNKKRQRQLTTENSTEESRNMTQEPTNIECSPEYSIRQKKKRKHDEKKEIFFRYLFMCFICKDVTLKAHSEEDILVTIVKHWTNKHSQENFSCPHDFIKQFLLSCKYCDKKFKPRLQQSLKCNYNYHLSTQHYIVEDNQDYIDDNYQIRLIPSEFRSNSAYSTLLCLYCDQIMKATLKNDLIQNFKSRHLKKIHPEKIIDPKILEEYINKNIRPPTHQAIRYLSDRARKHLH